MAEYNLSNEHFHATTYLRLTVLAIYYVSQLIRFTSFSIWWLDGIKMCTGIKYTAMCSILEYVYEILFIY